MLLLTQLLYGSDRSEHYLRLHLRGLRSNVGTIIGHCTGRVSVVIAVVAGIRQISTGIADVVVIQIVITILALIRHDLLDCSRALDVRLCSDFSIRRAGLSEFFLLSGSTLGSEIKRKETPTQKKKSCL